MHCTVVSRFSLHFRLYRGNLDYFSNSVGRDSNNLNSRAGNMIRPFSIMLVYCRFFCISLLFVHDNGEKVNSTCIHIISVLLEPNFTYLKVKGTVSQVTWRIFDDAWGLLTAVIFFP